MGMLIETITRTRRRLLMNVIAAQSAHAMNGFLGMLVLITLFGTDALEWQWLAMPPILIAGAGGWSCWRRFPDRYRAAQLLDQRLGLADVLSTAVFFRSAPARRYDEGMRSAQCENALRIAATVNPRQAVPLKIPRAALWSVLIACLAAGLITLRYGVEGKLDLRRPMVPPVQRLAELAQRELETFQQAMSQRTEDVSAQDDELRRRESAADSGSRNSSATAATQPKQQRTGAAKDAAGSESDPAAEENGQSQVGGGEQEAKSGSEGKPNEQKGHKNGNPSASAQQQSGNANESSSVLNKISNSVANLLSAMKPHPGSPGQNAAEAGRGGKPQGGRNGKQGTSQDQGSQGADSVERAEASDQQGDLARASANGQNADGQPGKLAGSGAGESEGDKASRKAEQLAAMGKISLLFGRRSESLSGTAAVEVLSGEQELTTRYQDRKVDHRDAHAKAERDEVPIELQGYVNQYFVRLRESGVEPGHSKKK
jgi:hypothetical protein